MGKNQSASNLINIINYNNGNILFVSGSTTLMTISSSGEIITTGVISGSNILTSSYSQNSELLDNFDATSFVFTSSYNTDSSSFSTRVTNNESTGSSLTTASGSFSTRVSTIESKYATTGSNTFTGPQYVSHASNAIGFTSTASLYTDGGFRVTKDAFVSGTLYLNNLTVYGTSSIQYITSSQLNVATNIITVNTDTPAVRFGGLTVYDSGSLAGTGSLFWDSEQNHWVYANPSGSTYSGGMLMSGPRSQALGSEQGTTACALMMGQGGDHITSSAIFHYGNATCFYGNTVISSSGTVCTTMANASCIGVGTTTPRSTADINGVLTVGDGNPPGVNLYRNVALGNNSSFGSINFGARYDATNYGIGASIYTNSVGVWSSTNYGGNLLFATTPQNSTTLTERMRITSGGCIGINSSSPAASLQINATSPLIRLQECSSGGDKRIELSVDTNGLAKLSANQSAQVLAFETVGSERMRFCASGDSYFTCAVYAKSLGTNDLILNNLNHEHANYVDGTRGSWLIQEGACDLFIINQVTCKKYKFNLIEIK